MDDIDDVDAALAAMEAEVMGYSTTQVWNETLRIFEASPLLLHAPAGSSCREPWEPGRSV